MKQFAVKFMSGGHLVLLNLDHSLLQLRMEKQHREQMCRPAPAFVNQICFWVLPVQLEVLPRPLGFAPLSRCC